jgi:hypothetical protein
VTVVVVVLCIAWLAVSLPLGVLLGCALRRADAADLPEQARPVPTPPAAARLLPTAPLG